MFTLENVLDGKDVGGGVGIRMFWMEKSQKIN